MKSTFLKRLTVMALAMTLFAGCTPKSLVTDKNNRNETPDEAYEETSGERHSAYRDIVQDIVDNHGFYSVDSTTLNGISIPRGIWVANEMDITGDGKDELFLVYGDGETQVEVYEYNNGVAESVWGKGFDTYGSFTLGMNKRDGYVYWAIAPFMNMTSEIVTYKDGEYKSSYGRPKADYENDAEFDSQANALHERADMEYLGLRYTTDGKGYLWSIRHLPSDEDIAQLTADWELTLPKRPTDEILGDIAYLGDRSKCKMTKDMALAYADAIKKEQEYANTHTYETYTLKALLIDLANDGMPLLLTVPVCQADYVASYDDNNTHPLGVWGFDGKKASRYDFLKDAENDHLFDISFYPENGDDMIVVDDGLGVMGTDYWGTMGYTVSDAKITLTHHDMMLDDPEYYESLGNKRKYEVYTATTGDHSVSSDFVSADAVLEYLTEYAESYNTAVSSEPVSIDIDFSRTDEGAEYLKSIIDGNMPDDNTKTDIADFIRMCVTRASRVEVTPEDNKLTLSADTVKESSHYATSELGKLNRVLKSENIDLNKAVETNLEIICNGIDLDGGFSAIITAEIADAMRNASSVTLVLGGGYTVTLSRDAVKKLTDKYPTFTIVIRRVTDTISKLEFKDADGNAIASIGEAVTFSVPADNELCTVTAEYSEGTDNWGGQYDAANGTVIFSTPYSGNYTVTDTNITISDIAELSDEHQQAIQFMVSRSCFELDGDKFYPKNSLTRYAFTEALVRIFFELDRTLTTSFTDVPEDSKYYPFVASGEAKDIIYGYDDNVFCGDNSVTVEEVLALCARTLIERKEYKEPQNADKYLGFTDAEEISDWAERSVALCVREELIDEGGELHPTEAISNADAALILYRLYMLLHEVDPTNASVLSLSTLQIVLLSGLGVIFTGLITTLVIILIKQRKRRRR